MRKVFVWNSWNIQHIAKHEVSPDEARDVVDHASRPYPMKAGDRKWVVRGRTPTGRALQVIFLVLDPEEVEVSDLTLAELVAIEEGEDAVYVIHARDLTTRERRGL